MVGDRIIHGTDSLQEFNDFLFLVGWPGVGDSDSFQEIVFRCKLIGIIRLSNQSNVNF